MIHQNNIYTSSRKLHAFKLLVTAIIIAIIIGVTAKAEEISYIKISTDDTKEGEALVLPLNEVGENFNLMLYTFDNEYARMDISFTNQAYIDIINKIAKISLQNSTKIRISVGDIQNFHLKYMGMPPSMKCEAICITGIKPEQAEKLVKYFLNSGNKNILIWGRFLVEIKEAAESH